MKKLISLFIAFLIFILPTSTAFAMDAEPASGDYYISEEDFMKLEHVVSESSGITPYTTGLITDKKLGLATNGNNLIIQGYTGCIYEVVKCGFTYITLQRYENGAWKDYTKFEDIYSESNYCNTAKYVAAAHGYSYRVVAKHYAKKNIFSTEKIENTTASIWF